MTRAVIWASACLCLSLTATICSAANAAQINHGRYLVEEVAKCGDCHTPMLPSGQPNTTKWLKGATLAFKPIVDIPVWQGVSPDVTPGGHLWKSWGEAGFVRFLTTGVAPNGHPPRPPMPAYKMKPADARAIVAYLKSLK